MPTIHIICGKICSGKTFFARRLASEQCAVLLSTDEITMGILGGNLGEQHDTISTRVNAYLLRKAEEILRCGTDVVLDWGFWSAESRRRIRQTLAERGLSAKWYFIDASDEILQHHIVLRNSAPGENDYFVDEGLLAKCLSLFEVPDPNEIDIWIHPD